MAFKMIFELLLLLFIEAVYRRCFEGKGVFRNFAKFTRKRLCQSLFFSKVPETCSFVKKETGTETDVFQ